MALWFYGIVVNVRYMKIWMITQRNFGFNNKTLAIKYQKN